MERDEQQLLERGLRGLRDASAALHAPPELEATLLRAFDRTRPRPWYARLTAWQLPLAGSACAVLAGLVLLRTPGAGPEAPPVASDDVPFIALAPADRLRGANLAVLDTTVSGLELAGWGVPVEPSEVDDTVRAQLLVDADGQTLALRLLD